VATRQWHPSSTGIRGFREGDPRHGERRAFVQTDEKQMGHNNSFGGEKAWNISRRFSMHNRARNGGKAIEEKVRNTRM